MVVFDWLQGETRDYKNTETSRKPWVCSCSAIFVELVAWWSDSVRNCQSYRHFLKFFNTVFCDYKLFHLTVYCMASLNYGWGYHSKFRWYDMMIWYYNMMWCSTIELRVFSSAPFPCNDFLMLRCIRNCWQLALLLSLLLLVVCFFDFSVAFVITVTRAWNQCVIVTTEPLTAFDSW